MRMSFHDPCDPRPALVGAALVLSLVWMGAGCGKKQAGGGFQMPPTPVETAKVVRQRVADRFEAVGTVEAGDAITVVSEIDGTVVSLPFQEGGTVDEGELLAQLDDDQLQADVDRAEALREQNQVTYQRVKEVVGQGAGAPQDLDDAAANLKVAEANLSLAKARLKKTRITAPFAGIVGARRVSPGAFLRAGTPITDLARIDELRINFSAPERYLAKLRQGAEVAVSTIAYPDYQLKGKILVVEPVLDPQTRSARVVALVDNPEGKLRPGMSANVAAVLAQRENALLVPAEAIFAEGSQSFVYVVKSDSTVTKTAVGVGIREPELVEVTSGLKADMTVVRTGHQKLYQGAHVMPVSGTGTGDGKEASR